MIPPIEVIPLSRRAIEIEYLTSGAQPIVLQQAARGAVGPPPELAIGTVGTGAPGSAVEAELIPDGPGRYILNLVIPEGDAGADSEVPGPPGRDAYDFAPNFTGDGAVYLPAYEAMTLSAGNGAIGTGGLAYAKSTAAAPAAFTATTLPVALEAGAWLRITASGVSGFLAAHLRRTA